MNDISVMRETANIAKAYLSNNIVTPSEVPGVISGIYGALAGLGEPEEPEYEPVMDPRKAVKADSITCLCCGTKGKMLKRHLMTAHGLTPDEYRQRFGLASDYPMVAPDYAEKRRDLAKKIGLGTHPNASRGRKKAGK